MNKKIKFSVIVISLIIAFVSGWIIGNSSFFNSQSHEVDCLRIYKELRENLRTEERQLGERDAILKERELVIDYVDKECPNFPDLEFMYQQALKVEP